MSSGNLFQPVIQNGQLFKVFSEHNVVQIREVWMRRNESESLMVVGIKICLTWVWNLRVCLAAVKNDIVRQREVFLICSFG